MGRKKSIIENPTRQDLKNMKTCTPLQKREDAISTEDIIRSDDAMFKVHFMSKMMLNHRTREEIKEQYEKEFGREISFGEITRLKNMVRQVYLAETIKTRDEMIADELMHAEWELRELQQYWERSKNGKRKVTKHKADSEGTELTIYNLNESTEVEEETIGDLEAMKRINDVRERMIKVLGLEAPKQQTQESTRPSAITIEIVDVPKKIQVQDIKEDE